MASWVERAARGNMHTLWMLVVSPRHVEDAMLKIENQGEIVDVTGDGESFDLVCYLRAYPMACSSYTMLCSTWASNRCSRSNRQRQPRSL